MLSSFKKSPVEQETIGCYSIFQVGSLSKYNAVPAGLYRSFDDPHQNARIVNGFSILVSQDAPDLSRKRLHHRICLSPAGIDRFGFRASKKAGHRPASDPGREFPLRPPVQFLMYHFPIERYSRRTSSGTRRPPVAQTRWVARAIAPAGTAPCR